MKETLCLKRALIVLTAISLVDMNRLNSGFAHAATAPLYPSIFRTPLTVAEQIESRIPRVLGTTGHREINISPNRQRFVITLFQGDLQRNGNWVEFIAGNLTSIEAAAHVETVAKLFTTSKREDGVIGFSPTYPGYNKLQWLDDNRRIAFQWNDGSHPTQIYTLDVLSRELRQVTAQAAPVVSFGMSRSGESIAFVTTPLRSSLLSSELERGGFAVTAADFSLLTFGYWNGVTPWQNLEAYSIYKEYSTPRRIATQGIPIPLESPADFSPDGRYAFFRHVLRENFPAGWLRYAANKPFARQLDLARRMPHMGYEPRELVMVDLQTATVRRPLEVPSLAPGMSEYADEENVESQIVWSADSKHVLIGPTFLPASFGNDAGIRGHAVAEVSLETGEIGNVELVAGGNSGQVPRPLRWNSDDTIDVEIGPKISRLARASVGWRKIRDFEPTKSWSPVQPDAVRVEWQEDLNNPPRLLATDTGTGRSVVILDPSAQIRDRKSLGHVEAVRWEDDRGNIWTGRLYFPINRVSGSRVPLVIQTHGGGDWLGPDDFSLLGNGDSAGSAFAAQILAGRGMAVLQVYEDKTVNPLRIWSSPEEPETIMSAYDSAVRHFAQIGLIDSEKVGLVGFSRSGAWVLYTIAHSTTHYAAANVEDAADFSYMQALLGLNDGATLTESQQIEGASPLDSGLQLWMKHAPAFNTKSLRTPLRLEADTGGPIFGALNFWEVFSRLKHSGKPVELFIVPDSAHADHPLQIPAQRLISAEGTVDWMDFWLNSHEDPATAKRSQYERWRKLQSLTKLSIEASN